MIITIPEIANDVVPRMMRTPSECEIVDLVRARTSSAIFFLHDHVKSGEVWREPRKWLARFIAGDPETQKAIVSLVSRLTAKELQQLQPAALLTATMETIEYLRLVLTDEKLASIIRSELQPLFAEATEESL